MTPLKAVSPRPTSVPEPDSRPESPEVSTLHVLMLVVEYNRKLQLDNAKYLRAILRESHHMDVRTDTTDRLTRERLVIRSSAK